MERGNKNFYIEQINGVFGKNRVCITRIYTRVRDFLCSCSLAEGI